MYLLLWIITLGNVHITSGAAEFGSAEACNNAAVELRGLTKDLGYTTAVRTACVQTGISAPPSVTELLNTPLPSLR